MFWIPNFTEEVKKFVWWLWDSIQQLLGIPSTFINLPVAQFFIGNSIGVASKIVFYVFLVILALALVFRRKRNDAAFSFINLLVATSAIPLGVLAAEGLIGFGDVLKKLALEMDNLPQADQASNELINVTLPFIPLDQAIVTLFFSLLLASVGLQLLIVMVAYEFANVVLISLGVIVFALSGIGENTRKFFSLIISVFAVTGVLGLPVLLFVTQFAQGIGDALFQDTNPAGSILLLFVGAVGGLILQPVMMVFFYKRVSVVVGKMLAKFNDKLRAVLENKQRQDSHLAGSERTTMSYRFNQSIARTVNKPIDKFDTWRTDKAALATKRIADAATRFKAGGQTAVNGLSGAQKAATAVTGAAGVAAKVIPHPAAKVAVTVGSSALNMLINKAATARIPRAGGGSV